MQTETPEFGFPFSTNKVERCAWNSIIIQVTQDPRKGRAIADELVTTNVSTAVKHIEVDPLAVLRLLIDRVTSTICHNLSHVALLETNAQFGSHDFLMAVARLRLNLILRSPVPKLVHICPITTIHPQPPQEEIETKMQAMSILDSPSAYVDKVIFTPMVSRCYTVSEQCFILCISRADVHREDPSQDLITDVRFKLYRTEDCCETRVFQPRA
jgi:hypothetical protein